jgi:S-(hydroxymethyl)glutathione dehydrogenase/alcohol dehydrogenase
MTSASVERTLAVVVTGPGAVEVSTIRLRATGPGEVLVAISASAMCITDALGIDGAGLTPYPLIPGHSAVGTVVEVGPAVERIAVGDRVAVTGTAQCGHCYWCLHGSPSACADILGGMSRMVGWNDDGDEIHVDGGLGTMAERMLLRASNLVVIEPGDVPDVQLAALGCGIASGVGAVLEVARVAAGDSVAVHGCGNLGLWMVQAAHDAGADPIIVIDPIAERRRLALRLGATHALEPSPDLVERVRELTGGRGVDASFEAAGLTSVMETAFATARNGGTVVPTGMESPTASVTINGYEFALGAKRILSSQTGGGDVQRTIPEFLDLLRAGRLHADPIITRTFDLMDFAAAVDAARSRTVITGVVVMGGGARAEVSA